MRTKKNALSGMRRNAIIQKFLTLLHTCVLDMCIGCCVSANFELLVLSNFVSAMLSFGAFKLKVASPLKVFTGFNSSAFALYRTIVRFFSLLRFTVCFFTFLLFYAESTVHFHFHSISKTNCLFQTKFNLGYFLVVDGKIFHGEYCQFDFCDCIR